MLKETIKYKDYNGKEVEEDFYFYLSKSDIIDLETSIDGGLTQVLQKISRANNGNAVIREIKRIVLAAYGEKSPDGKRFMKSEEISRAFRETPAYDQFFMDLVTDAEKAVAFFTGIMPADMQPKMEEIKQEAKAKIEELKKSEE